jgi:hypothetical protein
MFILLSSVINFFEGINYFDPGRRQLARIGFACGVGSRPLSNEAESGTCTAELSRLVSEVRTDKPSKPAAQEVRREPRLLEADGNRLDDDRVDAVVLAALLLTAHRQSKGDAWRSWKNLSWEATDRLYERATSATRRRRRSR